MTLLVLLFAIKLFARFNIVNFNTLLGKTNFEVQRNFSANTALVVLFEIRFRSLFFEVEKRRQYNEVKAIP